MRPTLAIVGRPNVGKSTLFNRLVGRRLALVDDQPGVTRDRKEAEGQLFDLEFRIFDTAGLEDASVESLEGRMRSQTEQAAQAADVVLFLIDARAGVTPTDRHFAAWLRRSGKPVVLIANKCEGREAELAAGEAYALGLGAPVPLSAEHGLGLGDLHDALVAALGNGERTPAEEEPAALVSDPEVTASPSSGELEEASGAADNDEARRIQLAVVGRPNVGKSTLVNRLLGEERLLTGPEAGITRDAISVEWTWRGRALLLVDTAGLRRRARVSDRVEKLSSADTLRAVQFAEVVILMIDAEQPMERQDLTIARHVIDEGRALLIAVNKWDLAPDRSAVLSTISDRLERSLPQVRGIPVIPISASKGSNLEKLMQAVFAAYEVWNRRVPTAALNRWLDAVTAQHPPPAPQGRRIKLKYMTQAKTRPPTFALFCSQAKALPDSYLRYLENSLREAFNLPGTPIRLLLRGARNPYVKNS